MVQVQLVEVASRIAPACIIMLIISTGLIEDAAQIDVDQLRQLAGEE